jgi:hypothetical protein
MGFIIRGFIKMRSLSTNEIGIFASQSGAHKSDVENFLDTVGQAGTEEGAMLNLHYDARLYNWDIATVLAIEAGIRSAYAEVGLSREGGRNSIETPLPGAHYSLWPQRDL